MRKNLYFSIETRRRIHKFCKSNNSIEGEGEVKAMRTIVSDFGLRHPWTLELDLSNRHLEVPAWNLRCVSGLELKVRVL